MPSAALPAQLDVFRALLQSRATPLRAAALGAEGAWLVQWRNADTDTAYTHPSHHTLSLYLEGGEAVRCLDQPAARGAPGSLCCLPAGHVSRWAVRGSLQLLHLYLPRLPLALAAEQWFDRDPRLAHLDDRIYFDDPLLARLGRQIVALHWHETDAALRLQELGLQMQARLLLAHGRAQRTAPGLRGGLSPQARRRVLECIEAALPTPGRPSLHVNAAGSPGRRQATHTARCAVPTPQGNGSAVCLAALADAACLSPYHFARMFKASFGMSPHAWVMQRRLALARRLLADARLSLPQVAAHAGYAHPNHLNAALRSAGLGSAARCRRVALAVD